MVSSMVSFDFCRKVFTVSALVFMLGAPLPTHAATNIDTACDPTYLDRLRQRAWGEVQREIMTNQQMIWKPDSVLALGCYDAWIGAMGISFSKDGGTGLNSIKNQASTYLNTAFNHTLGGGNLGGANTSNCANIRTLWESAECKNMNLTQLQSLGDASSSDPRVKPKACGNTGPAGWWTNAKDVITKGGANTAYDTMNLFTSVVAPKSEAGSCSAGIPTGVKLAGGSNPEIVCPNPGCVPDGAAAPKCN